MNWRGRPLASHEVIVQTIAATTTRTGLRVHAELDTSTYDTGIQISDRQMDVLPLTRHDWHGDWNYTLRPQAYDQVNTAPDPFDQPSPDLAWANATLALTGLPAQQWDALIATLMTLHGQQREASLDKRRGHRPRLRPRHRPPPCPHPRRPAPGHPPPPPPRPAPGRHRPPVQRPPRDNQQAHPRHPPAPGTGRVRHPARPAPASQPGRPLQPRSRRKHHDPATDQHSVLILCRLLSQRCWNRGQRRNDHDCRTAGRRAGLGRVAGYWR